MMHYFVGIGIIIVSFVTAICRPYFVRSTPLAVESQSEEEPMPVPITKIVTPPMNTDPDAITYPWDSPQHNWHNARVLCDNANLSVSEKNIISACIYQESRFNNAALNHNKNSVGKTVSTDYGICQVNDFYHIGQGKDFPDVQYVLNNPARVVSWMISMYKQGLLKQWVSYSSGAYKQWLVESSPMWNLAKV